MMDEKIKIIECYSCLGDDCLNQDDDNNTIISSTTCWSELGKCFTSVDLTSSVTHQRGCVDDATYRFCPTNDTKHFSNNIDAYIKCCSKDLCNNDEFLFFKSDNEYDYDGQLPSSNPISIFRSFLFVSLLFIISFILIVILTYFKRKYKSKKPNLNGENNLGESFSLKSDYNNQTQQSEQVKISLLDSTIRDGLEEFTTGSGSGSGNTLLNQRTFAKNINLIECVGKGRYGEVWKGIFHYEEVAVKIFLSRDEASFQRENEIYSNYLLKHENILTFIGSDVTSKNSCTQLWLVTTYHELGSLFDYLNYNTINLQDMFSIMVSIASGLIFLHNENFGTQQKPAIAHRDIKSKNILMKSKQICCIADFGLAVTKNKTGELNIACNYRVGTKRYMAPEVLDGTFHDKNFDSYKKADIYSFSLVLWEIVRRFEKATGQHHLNYEVPYQYKVPNDPSFDDMRKVVCLEQYRPEIPIELEQNQDLGNLCQIIQEGWSKNPSSRLSALRIKKSLINLQTKS